MNISELKEQQQGIILRLSARIDLLDYDDDKELLKLQALLKQAVSTHKLLASIEGKGVVDTEGDRVREQELAAKLKRVKRVAKALQAGRRHSDIKAGK